MTIQELIFKLQDYDPTAVVCIRHQGEVFAIDDEVYPPENVKCGAEEVLCVVFEF